MLSRPAPHLLTLLPLTLLTFFTPPATATELPAQRVGDINTKERRPQIGLGNVRSAEVPTGDHVFEFYSDDHGEELWITDGTTPRTSLLLDIEPGPGSSEPGDFVRFGSKVFFRAFSTGLGSELWVTDGTVPGTTLYADIEPGEGSSFPIQLTVSDGLLYFSAITATTGRELWVTDGLGPPTVVDIYPGAEGSAPEFLAPGPTGGVYFSATTQFAGREPRFSRGTAATTSLVSDLISGPTSSNPWEFTIVDGGIVAFVADNATLGRELVTWQENTSTLTWHNIPENGNDAHSTSPTNLLVEDPESPDLFLVATTLDQGRELYLWSEGDPAPLLIKDINPGIGYGVLGSPVIDPATGFVYFAGLEPTQGLEPWKSNGTAAGTKVIKDLVPGAGHSGADRLALLGGRLFFQAHTPLEGTELWSSDGTDSGTDLYFDADPGPDSSDPWLGFAVQGNVVFRATAASDTNPAEFAYPLFGGPISGGTVHELARAFTTSSDPSRFATGASGDVYFRATSEAGSEPWKIDVGISPQAELIEDLYAGPFSSSPRGFLEVNGHTVFSAFSTVWEPHVYDGTTVQIIDLVFPADSRPRDFVRFGDEVLLFAQDPDEELWRLDLETSLFEQLTDSTEGSSFDSRITVAGDLAFFPYDDGLTGLELWKTDGTVVGTEPVVDLTPGSGDGIDEDGDMAVLQAASSGTSALVVFQGCTPAAGCEPWISDGTVPGTQPLLDIEPGASGSFPKSFVALDGRALFVAQSGGVSDVWVTDGKPGGTLQLTDRSTGFSADSPVPLGATSAGWFYSDKRTDIGEEPWFTDGTLVGTVPIDLNPGAGSSSPEVGVSRDDELYFFAFTPSEGRELWASDGSPGGTVAFPPLIAGPAGQRQITSRGMSRSGHRIFFAANRMDGAGVELYSYSLEEPLFYDGFESGDLSAWD